MPFSGNQNQVLRRGAGDGIFNGGLAVSLDQRGIRHGGQDVVDDVLRRFHARVVAGDHHFIGGGRGRAHQRTFAAIAVAAAAEHAPQLRTLRLDFVKRGDGFFERVGGVGIIDHHQRLAGLHDTVHAAGGGTDLCQRGQYFFKRITVGTQQADAGGEVLGVEAAKQAAVDFAVAPRGVERHRHAV